MSSKKKEKKAEKASPNIVDLHSFLLEDIKMGSNRTGQCFTATFLADRHNVSTSTVYNHLRQYYRDGVPIFKTPRGLVLGNDTTVIDQVKLSLRLASRRMNSAIEANAVCPVITKTWAGLKVEGAATVLETAKALMGDSNGWTRRVHGLYNIIDSDREKSM